MDNFPYRIVIMVFLLLLLAGAYNTLFIYYSDFNTFRYVTVTIMIVVGAYYIFKLVRRYPIWYSEYMFNRKPVGMKKKVEKPRLFFYSFSVPIMLLSIFVFLNSSSYGLLLKDVAFFSLIFGLFIISLIFMDFTWSMKFEERFLPKAKKIINENKIKDFEIELNKSQLENMFDNFVKHGIFMYDDDQVRIEDRESFVRLFLGGKFPLNPMFKLEFRNPSTSYLLTKLQQYTVNLNSSNLGKIFTNKNGHLKPGSLYASKSNNRKYSIAPKYKDDIDQIFNEMEQLP